VTILAVIKCTKIAVKEDSQLLEIIFDNFILAIVWLAMNHTVKLLNI